MKKKILCVLLALCLFASLLPMTALAADPDITVTFFNKGTNTERDNKTPGVYIWLTIKPGDPAKYITANAEGYMTEHTGDTAPADNFIKLEYPADGAANLKVTLKNIYINGMTANDAYHAPSIEFGEGAYSINMELIGDNKIVDGRSACIKNNNDGGLTITGAGSLAMQMGATDSFGAAAAALWANGGDLVIKNTTVNFEIYTSTSSQHNSILSAKGNVLLENVTIKNKTNNTGKLVFTGLATANDPRYTIDPDANRKVTIKNCNIESATGGSIFRTVAPVVINNSTIKATGGAPLFEGKEKDVANNPVIEGEFSGAYASKANATKQNKWKALTADNMSKLKSCGFVYIVPGIVELVPTEPTTEPEPTTKPTTGNNDTTKPTTKDEDEVTQPTTEETIPDETQNEATQPTTADKNEATQPTTADKNEAAKPTTADKDDEKDDNKTDDATEEKSGSPLVKVILIILIVLVVAGGAAVGVIFYLRSKNAAEEGEEKEAEEESESEEE